MLCIYWGSFFFPPCLSALWANEVTLHNGVWPYQWDGQHCCLSKIMWHVNELPWHMGQSLLLKAVYISVFRTTFTYSWYIPCTLNSWCNDVNNDLLMLTVPSDLGSQTVAWHNLPAACDHDIYDLTAGYNFLSRALGKGELMLLSSCRQGW